MIRKSVAKINSIVFITQKQNLFLIVFITDRQGGSLLDLQNEY